MDFLNQFDLGRSILAFHIEYLAADHAGPTGAASQLAHSLGRDLRVSYPRCQNFKR